MSRIIRRGHLILVAAFGKRVADPPPVQAAMQRHPSRRKEWTEADKQALRDRINRNR
jgi:hypothetical protein